MNIHLLSTFFVLCFISVGNANHRQSNALERGTQQRGHIEQHGTQVGLTGQSIHRAGPHRDHPPHGQGHTGTHIDLPWQYDNNSPHPVVHREPAGHGNQAPHVPGQSGTHIDLPWQHNNSSPYPVVHRVPAGHGDHAPHVPGQSSTHIDLPWQHNNSSPYPVVHRVPAGHGQTPHVDLTGQSPHTAIHRAGPHGDHSQHVPGQSSTHIDLPWQHNNNSPHPVVHRVPAGHGQTWGPGSNVAVVNRTSGTDHGGHTPHAGDVQSDGRVHTGHVARLTIPLDRSFGDGRVVGGLPISSSIVGLSPGADRQIDRLIGPRFPLLGSPGGPIGLPPFSPPFRPGFMPPPPPGMRGPQPFGPFGPPFRDFGPPPQFGGGRPRFMRRRRRRRIRRLLRERALTTGQTVPDLLESLLSSSVRSSTRG